MVRGKKKQVPTSDIIRFFEEIYFNLNSKANIILLS